MLIALWLVIAQLLGASSSLATTSGGSLRASVAGAVVVPHAGKATADGGAADRDASLRDEESGRAVAWLRAAQPLARVAAPRNETPRSVPPTTAALAQRRSIDAVLVTSVHVRALGTSHAVAARGALLSYFATAPPLQG